MIKVSQPVFMMTIAGGRLEIHSSDRGRSVAEQDTQSGACWDVAGDRQVRILVASFTS